MTTLTIEKEIRRFEREDNKMDDKQYFFLEALHDFIQEVEQMPRFRGQTQALKALRRIRSLSVFGG